MAKTSSYPKGFLETMSEGKRVIDQRIVQCDDVELAEAVIMIMKTMLQMEMSMASQTIGELLRRYVEVTK